MEDEKLNKLIDEVKEKYFNGTSLKRALKEANRELQEYYENKRR